MAALFALWATTFVLTFTGTWIWLTSGPQGATKPEPDWSAVASCVWDRWDAGADMTPVVRFCYTWGPRIYGETTVP